MRAAVFVDRKGYTIQGNAHKDLIYNLDAHNTLKDVMGRDNLRWSVYGPNEYGGIIRGMLPNNRFGFGSINQIETNQGLVEFLNRPNLAQALRGSWIILGENYFKHLARFIDELHVFHINKDAIDGKEKFPLKLEDIPDAALIRNYYY